MTDRELVQQALEALEVMRPACFAETTLKKADTAITALRDRLAQPEQELVIDCPRCGHCCPQPEQEPVAWMTINAYGEEDDIHYENPEGHLLEGWTYKPLYTTPPTVQPEKEPLEYWNAVEGWVKIDEVREHFESVGCGTIYKTAGEGRAPLYTNPRQWVGLTDEEIGVPTEPIQPHEAIMFARVIEALIKGKNT